MQEISFGSLLIIALMVQKMQAHVPSPSCIYYKERFPGLHNGSFQDDCSVTREQDHCLTNTVYLPFNVIVTGNLTYVVDNSEHRVVNLTIEVRWGDKKKFMLMDKNGFCWFINTGIGIDYPYQLAVHNLPELSNSFEYVATYAYIVSADPICTSSINVCSQLNNTNLSFNSIPSMNQIHLSVKVRVDAVYKVELISGDCNITCEGNGDKCNLSIIYSDRINFTSKERGVIDFMNLTLSKYYCVRIESNDSCCAIRTNTRLIDDHKNHLTHIVDHHISYLAITFVVILFIILVLVIIFYSYKFKVYHYIRALNSPMNQPAEEVSNPLVQKSETNEIVNIIKEMKENTMVYLAYPYDPDLVNLMSSFRRLLKVYVKQVRDPFSEDDFEFFAKNFSAQVHKILTNTDFCIILIETEEGIPDQSDNCLNQVFLYTVDILRHIYHPRLFIIRLNPNINETLNFRTNYTRYNMPSQFDTLIYYINSNRFRDEKIDFEVFSRHKLWSEEKEDFIKRYNKLH